MDWINLCCFVTEESVAEDVSASGCEDAASVTAPAQVTSQTPVDASAEDAETRPHRLQRQDAKSRKTFKIRRNRSTIKVSFYHNVKRNLFADVSIAVSNPVLVLVFAPQWIKLLATAASVLPPAGQHAAQRHDEEHNGSSWQPARLRHATT